ncbi:MAG: MBL fold metallo-hydrolase [bacterium]
MSVRFMSIASGSKGNCYYLETAHSRMLVDCGIGIRRVQAALAVAGVQLSEIDAVVISHTHSDHISGLGVLLKHASPVVYCHEQVRWELASSIRQKRGSEYDNILTYDSEHGFPHRDIDILPCAVSHDAEPTCMFKFYCGRHRLGILTDLGCYGPQQVALFGDCELLVLESNHCPEILRGNMYPEYLKSRIRGSHGHLSNQQAVELSTGLASMPQHLLLGHLSENSNTPRAASEAFSRVEVGRIPHTILTQHEHSRLMELT